MGQNASQIRQLEGYQIVEELPMGNIVKSEKTNSMHFVKQYSFTSQQAYQNALNMHSLKLSNKNQHILNFQHFTTKSENTFCSTFHKIMLIYEYIEYSLDDEIRVRIKEKRPFTQKQIWSVLCSCVLAAVHLGNCEGKMHSALQPKDIRLNSNGCVKLLSHQMLGISAHHHPNSNNFNQEGTPKNLAITLLQCLLLQEELITNQDNQYLQNLIESLDCSRDLKEMLLLMINKHEKSTSRKGGQSNNQNINDNNFKDKEQLFKLVQDDESSASQNSNTPNLKQDFTINSDNSAYKCPKIYRNIAENTPTHNNQITKNSRLREISQQISPKIGNYKKIQTAKNKYLQPLINDAQDNAAFKFQFQYDSLELQLENPDETDLEDEGIEPGSQSVQKRQDHFISKYGNSPQASSRNQTQELKDLSNFQIKVTMEKQSKKIDSFHNMKENRENRQNKENSGNNEKLECFSQKYESFESSIASNIHNKVPEVIDSNENLFTDPKIFSMIRNDLKEIQSRKSLINNQSISSTYTQMPEASPEKKQENASQNKKTVEIDRITGNYFNKDLHKIEMIKETSQQYREEEESDSVTKFIKNQYRQAQSRKKNEVPENFEANEKFFNNYSRNQTVSTSNNIRNIMMDQEQGFKRKTSAINSNRNIKTDQKPMQSQQANTDSELVHVTERYQKGKYTGTKLHNKRHGHGTFYYSEGGKYVGNWADNKMNGYGVLYYPNGQIAYQGHWKSDQLSGWGVLYNQDVAKLRNPFDYRDWDSVDDFWIKYEGQFHNDNKQGSGKLYLSNGERLEAHFTADMVNGEGILHRDDGSQVRGKWKQNKLVQLF